MRFLQSRGAHSIIFASGTLAPLQSFISTMGMYELKNFFFIFKNYFLRQFGSILESKHCANSKNQLIIGALKKGLNGTDLLGTFQNRFFSYKKNFFLRRRNLPEKQVLIFSN
jgi:hypothetical protein